MVVEKSSLEVLVVEDREENRLAARSYFDTVEDVSVDFAHTYEEGSRMLKEGLYGVAIFDLELPRNSSSELERLGIELANEADNYFVPWAILTSGYDHHVRGDRAFACYSWNGTGNRHSFSVVQAANGRLLEKTDPESWKQVYETLISNTPYIEAGVRAREIYKSFVGRPYQKNKGGEGVA